MSTRTISQWYGGFVLALAVLFTAILPVSSQAGELQGVKTPSYYMQRVFEIGSKIGHPETLQAILLQESGGRKNAVGNPSAPLTQRSYGLMQVQINAARSILTRIPELFERIYPGRSYKSVRDAEIADMLIKNDDANIEIAAHHFNLYYQLSKGNWHRAVAAYNVGIGAVTRINNPAQFPYVKSIAKWKDRTIRPFNLLNGLSLTEETNARNIEPLPTVEPELTGQELEL